MSLAGAYALHELDNLVGYWPLGEASGNAQDRSGNNNDGTVTIGVGARSETALDVGGDGSLLFDSADTKVQIAAAAAIQDIWDGGGSVFFMFDADSDGEFTAGNIIRKSWLLHVENEAGGLLNLRLFMPFSGTNGEWSTAVNIPINTTVIGVLTYDADAVGNNPILYLWDGTSLTTRTVGSGLTEGAAPVGVRVTDATTALKLGNSGTSNATFDGHIDEVMLFSGILTANEATRLIALTRRARHTLGAAVSGSATLKEGAA